MQLKVSKDIFSDLTTIWFIHSRCILDRKSLLAVGGGYRSHGGLWPGDNPHAIKCVAQAEEEKKKLPESYIICL